MTVRKTVDDKAVQPVVQVVTTVDGVTFGGQVHRIGTVFLLSDLPEGLQAVVEAGEHPFIKVVTTGQLAAKAEQAEG